MKVVLNKCYGGLRLSNEAIDMFIELKKNKGITFTTNKFLNGEKEIIEYVERHDEDLVKVIESLGKKANGTCANFVIEEIISNKYSIIFQFGSETIKID